MCGHGGIGRRVRFRFLWSQGCAGSSPVVRTKKRQSERVVFFHAAADLKQNYVLSANGTAFVCPCTQLTRRTAIILPLLMLLRSLRSLQVLLSAPNKNKTNRNYSVRFFISWFATGLVTMQGIVCTLRVPLHAVQLAQRFASKFARLCYYTRFAHYKSCCPHQKKTIRKGCLFSCGSGLETKLCFVGKRHCVCLPLHAADMANEGMYRLKD